MKPIISISKTYLYTLLMYLSIHFQKIIAISSIKRKYYCLIYTCKSSYLFKKQGGGFSTGCENLVSILGIVTNNFNNFYEGGYMTPESIISACDEELLTLGEVSISFIKKLRKVLVRI